MLKSRLGPVAVGIVIFALGCSGGGEGGIDDEAAASGGSTRDGSSTGGASPDGSGGAAGPGDGSSWSGDCPRNYSDFARI